MTYLLSYLYCGVVCAISQYVIEKTKLTPGHINTGLVVIGGILSGFKVYDKIIDIFHAGACVPILNFGHLLVSGASEGYLKYGVIGLFKGILVNASAGLSVAICMAFIISIFFKVKH
ncbi:MAG: SpoVA/SpoVAEb family sporulation membrane protein [Bacilli bacterium]